MVERWRTCQPGWGWVNSAGEITGCCPGREDVGPVDGDRGGTREAGAGCFRCRLQEPRCHWDVTLSEGSQGRLQSLPCCIRVGAVVDVEQFNPHKLIFHHDSVAMDHHWAMVSPLSIRPVCTVPLDDLHRHGPRFFVQLGNTPTRRQAAPESSSGWGPKVGLLTLPRESLRGKSDRWGVAKRGRLLPRGTRCRCQASRAPLWGETGSPSSAPVSVYESCELCESAQCFGGSGGSSRFQGDRALFTPAGIRTRAGSGLRSARRRRCGSGHGRCGG